MRASGDVFCVVAISLLLNNNQKIGTKLYISIVVVKIFNEINRK